MYYLEPKHAPVMEFFCKYSKRITIFANKSYIKEVCATRSVSCCYSYNKYETNDKTKYSNKKQDKKKYIISYPSPWAWKKCPKIIKLFGLQKWYTENVIHWKINRQVRRFFSIKTYLWRNFTSHVSFKCIEL